MKYSRYIIMVAALAAAVSCNKAPVTYQEMPNIEFTAGIDTKAFLTSDDINVAGTQMAIYGYEDSDVLIDGVTSTYDASTGWALDQDYPWADGKDYAFFSYLTRDNDGHSAPAVTVSGRTLTLSSRAFDLAEANNNFDFCYSDVVYRSADKPDHSVVNLNLKHLYTAIAFSAHNYTGSTIEVKEVSLCGLNNQKRATINFADTGSEAAYDMPFCTWTNPVDAAVGSKKLNSSTIILNPGVECANIVGTASTTPAYYMFWPQTSGELTVEGWGDSNHQPTGGAYIKVVYAKDGGTFTKYARFPQDNDGTANLGWPAGTKRMMQIAFRDDYFTIKVAALPWDYSESTIKYDDEVTVAEALHFDSSTCTMDEVNNKVYFNGANPIRGSFKFSSPSEATWFISKEGDYDAFEIDNVDIGIYGDGLDRNYGSVDVVAGNSFTLYPKDVPSGRDYGIQLSFSVRHPDGEFYCIDDKIQPDGKWTIILTK